MAHVKSVLWLLLNMLQHALGNNLQFNFRARQVVNKETLPHWRLLPILNICKTFHEIHVPLNFLFKFTGINLVVLHINHVEFYLI